MKFKVDRYDVINESLRLETETLKSEVQEISGEKNKLQLELSAARIQMNYDKEVKGNSILVHIDQTDNKTTVQDDQAADQADKFADELLEKIEKLTEEKALISKALEEAAAATSNRLEAQETSKRDQGEQTDDVLEAEMSECQECKM